MKLPFGILIVSGALASTRGGFNEGDLWRCPSCTFHNKDTSAICEMCYKTSIDHPGVIPINGVASDRMFKEFHKEGRRAEDAVEAAVNERNPFLNWKNPDHPRMRQRETVGIWDGVPRSAMPFDPGNDPMYTTPGDKRQGRDRKQDDPGRIRCKHPREERSRYTRTERATGTGTSPKRRRNRSASPKRRRNRSWSRGSHRGESRSRSERRGGGPTLGRPRSRSRSQNWYGRRLLEEDDENVDEL